MLFRSLIPLNLLLETLALCWAGMWFGLRSRTLIAAVAWTLGIVQFGPVAAVMALMWAFPYLSSGKFGPGSDEFSAAIPILILFGIKNLGLILWARWRLRRELRVGSG